MWCAVVEGLKRQKAVTFETRKKEMRKQSLEAAVVFSRTAVNGTYCIQIEARDDDKKATNKQVNNNANKKSVLLPRKYFVSH